MPDSFEKARLLVTFSDLVRDIDALDIDYRRQLEAFQNFHSKRLNKILTRLDKLRDQLDPESSNF
jgi:hypothetical protein